MCGIDLLISNGGDATLCSIEPSTSADSSLRRRGPDYHESVAIPFSGGAYRLQLTSSVLNVRGEPTKQPFQSQSHLFSFNGNIWDGINVRLGENDGRILFDSFAAAAAAAKMGEKSAIIELVQRLEGPFAFVFVDIHRNRVWFARDVLGRRSLLWKESSYNNDVLHLTSITPTMNDSTAIQEEVWSELPSGVLFCWEGGRRVAKSLQAWPLRECEGELMDVLKRRFNVETSHDVTLKNIVNEDVSVPSDPADLLYMTEIGEIGESDDPTILMNSLLSSHAGHQSTFESALRQSVRQRVVANGLPSCKSCHRYEECPKTHSKIAVLFSGGVDSLLLTALIHLEADPTEPIDLLNVAFGESPESNFDVPDRKMGIAAFRKLTALYPDRKFRFVSINISKSELIQVREHRIRQIVSPCDTVLDDSLGCALWFAARGQGILMDEGTAYNCSSRILFTGTGADELLAGYARHRVKFKQDGWIGLQKELQMEMGRISYRNLGRDDRIISDHGRESRLPYLDESFIQTVTAIPVWNRANLHYPRGVGEKFLLRITLWKLGFAALSLSAKRAMQFGSRIAKLENRREKASDTCTRLTK